jgi:peptidyl-prolyl cis-trans isomerase B (cyclophilin B)
MTRLLHLLALLLVACGGEAADGPVDSARPARVPEFDFAPDGPIPDAQLGEFHVVLSISSRSGDLGQMSFELWPEVAPRAVRRFLRHCAEGLYDGTVLHRLVREFVVQGGDPGGTGLGVSPYGRLEPELTIDPAYRHGYGVLAMAEPPSLQFFVCVAESPQVWALDERPISRLGRLTAGVVTLEQIANTQVGFGGVAGERSAPIAPVEVTSARVVRGTAPAGGPIQRPPVDLQGQPEVVVVQHLWVTFTERARTPGLLRNRLEAEVRAHELLTRLRAGELEWESAVREYSDENLPREGAIPVRRMSNFGVLDLAAQRALIDGHREQRVHQVQLRAELAAGGISPEELLRRQEEKRAEVEQRISATVMERREDISATHYTQVAFGLEVGEVGLVEYDPYGSPQGWFVLRRIE